MKNRTSQNRQTNGNNSTAPGQQAQSTPGPVTVSLQYPDGKEFDRVEFPAAVYARIEVAMKKLGLNPSEFFELVIREKIERDSGGSILLSTIGGSLSALDKSGGALLQMEEAVHEACAMLSLVETKLRNVVGGPDDLREETELCGVTNLVVQAEENLLSSLAEINGLHAEWRAASERAA